MIDIETLKKLFQKEREEIIENFFTFLRFQSIATDPSYHVEVKACAKWLGSYLEKCGLKVETWPTQNAPVVFATLENPEAKETLLLYCHYDVQPVDPLEEWLSPPFEPTIRNGEVYARGAADNKGQCFYTITALKILLKNLKKLPVNIKFLIEGEEESGSVGLTSLLSEKEKELKADYLLIVDSGIEERDSPSLTLGARGIVCMDVTVQESQIDLHSGLHGNVAYNPNRALVEMLAKSHNAKGAVAIKGFYDKVIPLKPEEKKELFFDFDLEKFRKSFGFEPSAMEPGLSPKEAAWLRPSLEINGIRGGYSGKGFKTVIPARSSAKISCRLVPDQDPKEIADKVKNFLIENTPAGLKTTIEVFPGSGKGFRTNPKSRITKILSESYSTVFGKPCQKILGGGSLPPAVDLANASKAEMLCVGVALPDDHFHAPNEHFGLDRFEKGFLIICRAIELFG